ncbi:MAG: N-acetylmuramoyl-L-alanine amidase [Sulfurovum sp.]|nr:MAG: N-acetylmuramoyl-L-alanine amidase [Sulfurovum sp.]
MRIKKLLVTTTLLTSTLWTSACADSIEVVSTPTIKYNNNNNNNIEVISTPMSTSNITIIDKPIIFKKERIEMTKEYIKKHYGLKVDNIEIVPKIIVLHWTADMSFEKSFKRLEPQKLFSDRKDIVKASALNVSAQFLVARDGTIYRLMPENWMARHVIGLNYNSIGVENIGGKNNKKDDLTPEQLQSNIALVKYLKEKYPTITYLIGHHEYRKMEKSELWLEKDKGYRTKKSDPGDAFMSKVREKVKALHLRLP